MLSLRVLRTVHNDQEIYINTVTGEHLPVDASEDTFRQHNCLITQERDAIVQALTQDRGLLSLTIVPTWECNLRCTHCSVTTQLTATDNGEIDTDRLVAFIRQYLNRFHPRRMSVHFVGGEPLLRQEKCLEITTAIYDLLEWSDIVCMASLTTNATVEFTASAYKLFDMLDKINISIDGDEIQHNTQRRPLQQIDNPYQVTINNLQSLVRYGCRDKIHIKAAVRDEFYTSNNYREFLTTLAAIGVNINQILYGCLHPTDLKHDPDKLQHYQKLFGARPIVAPCCKYRLNNVWLVDSSNNLYDLPYKWAQSKLGAIDDDLDTILNNRRQMILDTFPCFNDDKCMSCPVLGLCWGQCANSDPLVHGKPSEFCQQDKLIEHVSELQRDGKLGDYMASQSCAAMIDRHVK